MIYANNENFMGKFGNCEPVRRILEFLAAKGSQLADGTHPLGDDGVKVQIKSHKPLPFAERRYETHIKYIDLQVVLEGEEYVYVQTLSDDMTVVEDKLEASDLRFHKDPAKPGVPLLMRPGYFALLMPEDAHKTECYSSTDHCRKVIAKIPVNLIQF